MRNKLLKTIILLSVLFALPAMSLADDVEQNGMTTIELAALLPLSGELASKGDIRQLAIKKGVAAANERWALEHAGLQFELIVEDSQSDPVIVLERAKLLFEEGVRLFIVGSSSEVESLQPWAAERDVIIISYSSTSPSLGIEGDGIFRMVPNDTEQAKALADLLVYDEVYGIVPVYRNDIYGQQLAELLTEEFTQRQGTVSDAIVYEPHHSDWELISSRISEQVQQLGIENDRIAIVTLSFDETADLLLSRDEIMGVRWFGADTVTLSPIILENIETAQQAHQVQLKGTTFGLPDSPELVAIQSELTEISSGVRLPDALFAYDIPGMLAAIIDQVDQPLDIVQLKDKVIEGSATYAGITGWTILDERGDRKYYHYDVWEVQSKEDDYEWEKKAKYVRSPGTPGFIQPYHIDFDDGANQGATYLFGYPDQALDVERSLTRAEFTLMLVSAFNQVPTDNTSSIASFIDATDIDPRAQYAVAKAQELEIVQGYGKQDFKPNRDITWFEAISMTVKALNLPVEGVVFDGTAPEFLDSANIPDWAKPSLMTAIRENLIDSEEIKTNDALMNDFQLGDATLMILEVMRRSEQQ